MADIMPPSPEPYYADSQISLHHGDSLAILREMPDQSVDCCVTSPPYFGLRDYGVEGQYGLEASPAEYVETMRALFAEVRRVLTDAVKPGAPPAKNLMGMPWRTAFALQDDGWILRNDIIWAKPNGMPESIADRVSCKHEHLFMFAKSPRYWFDLDPIREPILWPDKTGHTFGGNSPDVSRTRGGTYGKSWQERKDAGAPRRRGMDPKSSIGDSDFATNPKGRNPGDVWTIATQPFTEAHFAVMPQALAERAILAGCKPGGTVLDPFSGSGTTGLAATKHGRKYVGIDLSSDYLDLSLRTRFAQPGLDLTGGAA